MSTIKFLSYISLFLLISCTNGNSYQTLNEAEINQYLGVTVPYSPLHRYYRNHNDELLLLRITCTPDRFEQLITDLQLKKLVSPTIPCLYPREDINWFNWERSAVSDCFISSVLCKENTYLREKSVITILQSDSVHVYIRAIRAKMAWTDDDFPAIREAGKITVIDSCGKQ